MNLSIIIPTYNEAENISSLIQDIYKHVNDAEIVVVDDNSPDGTADIIQSLKKKFKNLKLLIRKEEKGLSSAVLAGFKIASGQNYCVMDADYSHPPEFIPRLRKELDDADMIFASRYVKGGGCENWPLLRRFISKFATILARQLTSVKDPMSGFFMLKKHIIKNVDLHPKGFKIGLEILVKGKHKIVKEIPFMFYDRRAGKSKLKLKTNLHYIHHLIKLYRYKQHEKNH